MRSAPLENGEKIEERRRFFSQRCTLAGFIARSHLRGVVLDRLLEDVALVVSDFEFPQERQIFFAKGFAAMMFLLSLDIAGHGGNL